MPVFSPHPAATRELMQQQAAVHSTTKEALDQASRDLIWLLNSPSLLKPDLPEVPLIELHETERLTTALQAPSLQEKLHTHLANRKSRFLGNYFEQLWAFFLHYGSELSLVANNLQVHEQGATLGEFDFLVTNADRSQFWHQELALKFYLAYNDGHSTRCLGPQGNDRLDLKYAKLLSQLALSSLPQAQVVLAEYDINDVIPQAMLKGRLFVPAYGNDICFPEYVNPEHLSGKWIHQSQLAAYLTSESDNKRRLVAWKILKKYRWLSPLELGAPGHHLDDEVSDLDALINKIDLHFEHNRHAVLLTKLLQQGDTLAEDLRLFVVPDSWPLTTKATPAL